MLDHARGLLSTSLAIDLGSSVTRVAVEGRGVIAEIPSVVAVRTDEDGTRIVAVGDAARQMQGRTPGHISAARPVRAGVIVEYRLAEALLREAISQALGSRPVFRPTAIFCVPPDLDETKRRAIHDAARGAGLREVHLVGRPIALALGAELPVDDPVGSIVVDIGGDTTTIGVVALGGTLASATEQIGGSTLDAALVKWIRTQRRLEIGLRAAEQLKVTLGVRKHAGNDGMRVRGRDLTTRLPREIILKPLDVAEALSEPLDRVAEAIRQVLSRTPAEVCADILERGVVLCGGSALLPGIEEALRERLGLPLLRADDPSRCGVLGAWRLLPDPEMLARVALV